MKGAGRRWFLPLAEHDGAVVFIAQRGDTFPAAIHVTDINGEMLFTRCVCDVFVCFISPAMNPPIIQIVSKYLNDSSTR